MNTDIWKSALPEQLNAWLRTSPLIAYTTITPLFFSGGTAGSEFLTYAAGKFYFALELEIGSLAAAAATQGSVVFYDQANVTYGSAQNSQAFFNTTAAAVWYYLNDLQLLNRPFSRLVPTVYSIIKFNGYRLNV